LKPMLQRFFDASPLLISSFPYFPDCAAAMVLAQLLLLRLCVPCCTTRPYFLAASTHLRPSKTLWLIGFSTYTSLPAWQAQMVMNECQWLQVATDTASSSLSSRAWRMSCTCFGLVCWRFSTAVALSADFAVSGSIK